MNLRIKLHKNNIWNKNITNFELDELVDLLNQVDATDNCAVDVIKKELAKQEDKNVKTVLMKILDSLE